MTDSVIFGIGQPLRAEKERTDPFRICPIVLPRQDDFRTISDEWMIWFMYAA